MDLVASSGLKTDLHIHSFLSAHKDENKVAGNTLENLGILVNKLKENEVNICAITDHDAFDYNLYTELKKEENNVNSIMKVFPGVEFSVLFQGDNGNEEIHIVTIFDDNDKNKVKNIENILKPENGKPKYDATNAFSEDKYISILKEIDINTVMIAHQKNSLLSKGKSKKNDASTLGEKTFNELLFLEYFEAYEFRNKKNEIFNKAYIFENKFDNNLRMITGSDCHAWEVYPKEDKSSTNEYSFTFIKCLPCFKGLVMAITDNRRIKLTNSFFNPTATKLDSIKLRIKGIEHIIPLSKGINVIIGNNSVGKSLLLYSINDNRKLTASSIRKGYGKYLDENKIDIITKINEKDVFRFDTQGEIRRLFEEGKLKASDFLDQHFPSDIDSKPFRLVVDGELERFYEAIQNKFEYDRLEKQLSPFKMNCMDNPSQSIIFLDNLKTVRDNDYHVILSNINEVISKLDQLEKLKKIEDIDSAIIKDIRIRLNKMHDKYNKQHQHILFINKKINVIKSCIKSFRKKYEKQITDGQKIISSYYEDISETVTIIVELITAKSSINDYKLNISTQKITPHKSEVYQYAFISKLAIEEISNNYIENVIGGVIKKNRKLSTKEITQESLKNMILYYPEEAITPLDALKQKITTQLDKDFTVKHAIILKNMDVYKELSSGFNAQIYFTLITGKTRSKGIYIIDQPEDHVSPKAIKEYLLDQFKDMGETRQVIMVTHNPQFIVNLDVDNVIFISKEDKHTFKVLSGALEYENDSYRVLKIVADNVEGGLETISRRMKRYEKGLQVEN